MTMLSSDIMSQAERRQWDELEQQYGPDYGGIQYTSTAEALPVDAPQPEYPAYTEPATETYSYAEAAPAYAPEAYSPTITPEYVPPTVYDLPELGGTYQSVGTPYAASPELIGGGYDTPVDPSMYAQFGFGSTGEGGLTDEQAAAAMFGDQSGDFFRNPQYAESDAQFDYTTNPANRNDLDPIGRALRASITPIEPLADAADFMKNAVVQNRSLANQVATGGITAPVSGGNYYAADPNIVNAVGDLLLPQTPLDLAAMAIPAALAFPDQGLYGALAEAIAFGPGQEIGALPDAARLRSVLDVPQFADEAAQLSDVAGRTVVPRTLPAAAAETAPLGVRIAGAGMDVADAVSGQADEFAGNIRLAKFPEQTRETIARWATDNADTVQQARRGVIPDAEVQRLAQQLVEDTGGDWAKVKASWAPGKAYNAEEILALNGSLASKADEVMQAARAVQMDDSVVNQTRLIQALTEQAEIQQIVTGAKAEAGRALRVNRQIVQMMDSSVDPQALRQALDATGQNPERIAAVAKMLTSGELNTPAKVNQFIRDVNKPGWWDMVTEYWYNSVLSGPWTHLRNMIGNSAATMTEPARRLGSAALDAPLARIQGRAQERFWQEVPASIAGALHGIPDGLRGALATMRGQVNPFAASRVELASREAIPGPLGKLVRIPSRALEMSDNFFYGVNYRMSLWADATRMARREGLTGSALQDRIAQLIANPPPSLVKMASGDSERLLFRGDPGNFAKTLTRLKNQNPAMNFIVPFIKTPANLFKFGIRNSPIGLLDVPMWKRVIAGNPEGVDELAQTLMGSLVATGFAAMVANGTIDITAGVPTDPAERDRFYREGKLPFAVKMPGVGWVQYNQIPGLDTTLASVAAVVEGVRNGSDVTDIASQTVSTIGQSLLDRSYMNGLSDFMDAVGDPKRFASGYIERQSSSFVPFSSALRQTAQAIDPTIRQAESIPERIQAGIPGLTENVQPRLNAFGEESQRSAPSPIQVSPETQSAVDAELERLGVEVSFVGSSIGGTKLSRDEKFTYQQMAGQMTELLIERVIADPRYERLSDEQKAQLIDAQIGNAREPVRDVLEALIESEAYQNETPAKKRQIMQRAAQLWLDRIEAVR